MNKNDISGGKKGDKKPSKFGLLNSISLVILILFIITGLYSAISEQSVNTNTIALSDLVRDVGAGKVVTITVKGDDLLAEYSDKTVKTAKKEVDSSVTETFSRYGLTTEKLSAVKINVEGPSGTMYWIVQIAPFIVPILFLVLLVWFFTRQVRGAGMQAFSFVQSKAPITIPDDTKQKVTFKYVVGS